MQDVEIVLDDRAIEGHEADSRGQSESGMVLGETAEGDLFASRLGGDHAVIQPRIGRQDGFFDVGPTETDMCGGAVGRFEAQEHTEQDVQHGTPQPLTVARLQARVLPFAEWYRLAGTELGANWQHLRPEWASVVVVEDGDQIVGCWSLVTTVHAEGVWIAPTHRGKAGVARRLLGAMRELATRRGVRAVVTSACDDTVAALLIRHLGATPLEGRHFVLPIGG